MANKKQEDGSTTITVSGPQGISSYLFTATGSEAEDWSAEQRLQRAVREVVVATIIDRISRSVFDMIWVIPAPRNEGATIVTVVAPAQGGEPTYHYWKLPPKVDAFEELRKSNLAAKHIGNLKEAHSRLLILEGAERAPLRSSCVVKHKLDDEGSGNSDTSSATDTVLETLDKAESWAQKLPEELRPEPRRLIREVREAYKAAKSHKDGLINLLGGVLSSFDKQLKTSSEQLRKQQSNGTHPAAGT